MAYWISLGGVLLADSRGVLSINTRHIAYLVNQYPTVSHTFIRREIVAVERLGGRVTRVSIRPGQDDLADDADRAERVVTRVVLGVGYWGLGWALLAMALTRPGRFSCALWLAIRLGWRSDRGVARHLAYLAEAAVLCRWLAATDVSHVHAHFATNSTAVALLCYSLGGPPYSFTVHGPDDYDRAAWLALDQKVAQARFVVVVSDYGRGQLLRWCAASEWQKIHVVRCGLDDTFFRQPLTPVADTPHLVCVGRLCREKGQALLLEAVACLKTEGVPCTLTLVGDGPQRVDLEARCRELELAREVRLVGWASGQEVRQHLLAARALVLPSLAENLPVVLMEALALARPVLSTDIGGIPELVEPGVNGWLVAAGSVEALTAALREVLQTPVTTLTRMGQAGAERVARQHDVRVSAQQLLRLETGGLP